jgi:hypothetical protein
MPSEQLLLHGEKGKVHRRKIVAQFYFFFGFFLPPAFFAATSLDESPTI